MSGHNCNICIYVPLLYIEKVWTQSFPFEANRLAAIALNPSMTHLGVKLL